MSKQRIYEVAKTFKVSSEALVKILREMGFSVRSHMSILNEEMLLALKKRFQEGLKIKQLYMVGLTTDNTKIH